MTVSNTGLKKTILIIDEKNSYLNSAYNTLSKNGYRTIKSATSSNIMHTINSEKPDLVLLSGSINETSASSVCRTIRNTYSLTELPILLSNPWWVKFDLDPELEAGVNDFVTKPYNEKKLLTRVKSLTFLKTAMERAKKRELSLLQSQINPHFVFNSLNTIISFCHTDSDKAAALISNFSTYLRLILNFDDQVTYIPLSRELEIINSFIEIQKARFGDLIKFSHTIDTHLYDILLPPLCIQPLVENSIKHASDLSVTGVHIHMSARSRGDVVELSIEDNGPGIDEEILKKLRNQNHDIPGIGLSNVLRRISQLKNAQMIFDSEPNRGTKITISLRQSPTHR